MAFDAEVLAELVEPLEDGAIAGEGAKADFIERLCKAKNFEGLLLRQEGSALLCRWLTHVAEEIVEAGGKRCDPARLLVLRSAHTVPSVDIQELSLQGHLWPSDKISFLQLQRRLRQQFGAPATAILSTFPFFRG